MNEHGVRALIQMKALLRKVQRVAGSARIATSSGTSLLLDVGACIGSYKYIGSYRYVGSGHIVQNRIESRLSMDF